MDEKLYPIGTIKKTHGIKGELNIALDSPYNPEDFRFLVFDIDGATIPFEIVSSRGNGESSRLVTLDGIDSVDEAKNFVGKTVYVLMSELEKLPQYEEEDSFYLSDLIGFSILDEKGDYIGKIVGFNDDTQNYLLEVEKPDASTAFIPYVDEWLDTFDTEKKIITMNLPEGLLDQ